MSNSYPALLSLRIHQENARTKIAFGDTIVRKGLRVSFKQRQLVVNFAEVKLQPCYLRSVY